MIVFMNVCDQCKNQSEIHTDEESNEGFEFVFYTTDLRDSIKNNRFSSANKYKSLTFCDKECLLEYLKENLDKKGNLKQ